MGCDCCILPKESREPIRYDPDFSGPIHNRSCTDILWLILFVIFLGGWGFVGYYSIKNGNLEKLLAPIDSTGKRCGMDAGLENKKYLVFFDISKCLSPSAPIVGCPTTQVCVERCPDRTMLFTTMDESTFNQAKSNMVCQYDINPQNLNYAQAMKHISDQRCASYVIKSQPVFHRCFVNMTEGLTVPDLETWGLNESEAISQIADKLKFEELSAQIVQDLVLSRWYLLGALVAVVVVCFIYILLLRWVVAPVVWASIGGLIALLGFALYKSYECYVYYRDHPVSLHQTTNIKGYAESIFAKKETWLFMLIAIAVILLILLIMVIFLRGRIVIATALIKEGSKAVYAVKSTVFFPIFPWLLQCAVIAYGVYIFMLLLSFGEPLFKVVNFANDTCQCTLYKEDYVTCDPVAFAADCRDVNGGACKLATCHFTGLDSPMSAVWLHLVHLLGFFWTMFFISGVADMMLASTFSTWYWTFKKRNLPFFTLTSGMYRTVRYHMGTVALGSLIIAIVRVIRVILEYIDQKIKKFDNAFTRCIMCFCKCFCWCLENFLKFINKNAYIMCAVHGGSFCKSARDAFSLLMRNIVRVVVLDKVTDFIFFLSKLLLSIGVGFAVYYLLQWNVVYEVTQGERLHYNYVPAIILSIAAYLICSIFFNVYAMAVDTLFLCFLEDCERNDGSPEKPYFMSKNLMSILGKRNKRA